MVNTMWQAFLSIQIYEKWLISQNQIGLK